MGYTVTNMEVYNVYNVCTVYSRYLQEVGYTDTILDVRSQRVRSLLGLAGSEHNGSLENKNLEHILNGTESPGKRREQDAKRSVGPIRVLVLRAEYWYSEHEY